MYHFCDSWIRIVGKFELFDLIKSYYLDKVRNLRSVVLYIVEVKIVLAKKKK